MLPRLKTKRFCVLTGEPPSPFTESVRRSKRQHSTRRYTMKKRENNHKGSNDLSFADQFGSREGAGCCPPRFQNPRNGGQDTCCSPDKTERPMSGMMRRCMKGCRWFPLVPIALGVVCFLLGYSLDPQFTRVLWMTISGAVILMGTICFVGMRMMLKRIKGDLK